MKIHKREQERTVFAKFLTLKARMIEAGFEWQNIIQILEKLDEEIAEFKAEVLSEQQERQEEEFGDTLLILLHIAHKLKIDPEKALHLVLDKVTRRFESLKELLAQEGKTIRHSTREERMTLWKKIKATEK